MPEDAVRALAAATRYAEWRARDRGERVVPAGIDREAAERLVERVLEQPPAGRRLTCQEVTELLAAYGIEVWGSVPGRTVDEAVAAAGAIGYPVVIKSRRPLHAPPSGLGGIRVDLGSEAQRARGLRRAQRAAGTAGGQPFVVQRMATPGVSCVVRTDEDPLFGPVVSFSVAGPPTELLGDIGHRIPPLTDVDVSDLISSVKAAPMLHGHRGAAPVHRAALADLIARVSVLADNLPEVA